MTRRTYPVLFAFAFAACVEKKDSPADEQTTTQMTMPTDAGVEKAPDDGAKPAPKGDGNEAPAPCTTSFAKTVLPAFDQAGCAALECHGTRLARGIRLEVEDPKLTYESLTAFAIDAKPYVKPGAAPDASSITCHLAGKCGVKMPPLRGVVPNELVKAVQAWLVCGAPNN